MTQDEPRFCKTFQILGWWGFLIRKRVPKTYSKNLLIPPWKLRRCVNTHGSWVTLKWKDKWDSLTKAWSQSLRLILPSTLSTSARWAIRCSWEMTSLKILLKIERRTSMVNHSSIATGAMPNWREGTFSLTVAGIPSSVMESKTIAALASLN